MLPTKMPSSLFEINRQYMVSLNDTNVMTGFGGGGVGGGGSGGWKPKKEDDKRFIGKPNSTKRTHKDTKKGGYDVDTKIGPDGRAVKERHYRDHSSPGKHTNPHDHEIDWSNGYPKPGKPINYPDGAPEFKNYKGAIYMNKNMPSDAYFEENRFKTISDFKWAMECNSEVEFEWNDKVYSITHPDGIIYICEAYKEETAKEYQTADKALEYIIDGQKLREIITKVKVWDRTI